MGNGGHAAADRRAHDPVHRRGESGIRGAAEGLLEAFRRSGLTSIGGHAFIGNARRRLATAVITHDVEGRVALLASVGAFHAAGTTDTRYSVGGATDRASDSAGKPCDRVCAEPRRACQRYV